MMNVARSSTRVRIADAAIRVIAKDGFDTVSVRSVAARAGLAPGTVQHHFASRDDLLSGALARISERQFVRIRALPPASVAADRLRLALREILPLDEARREEAIVWLAFSAAAPTRPTLTDVHRVGVELMRGMIRARLREDSGLGLLRPGVTIEREVILLAAVVDGLLLHGVNAEPGNLRLIEEALDATVRSLYEDQDDPDPSSMAAHAAPIGPRTD